MSDFLPLSPVLAYRYHLNFDELPADLRERIECAFVIPWNRLTPERRRRYAERWDYEHDPATERERKEVAELFDEMEAVSANIDKWENVGTPTARDLAIQQDRLQKLYKTWNNLDNKKRRMRGDYFGDCIDPNDAIKHRVTERGEEHERWRQCAHEIQLERERDKKRPLNKSKLANEIRDRLKLHDSTETIRKVI